MKIAVCVDGKHVRSYEKEILKNLQTLKCEIEVFSNSKIVENKSNFCLDSYLKFDAFLNARGKNHVAFVSVDEELVQERSDDYDVVLNFSKFNTDAKAKYGIWELRYGKEQTSAEFAGVKEVFDGDYLSDIKLIATKENNSYLLDSFSCATHVISPVKNRSDVAWKSHILVVRNIKRLLEDENSFITDKLSKLYFSKDKSDITINPCKIFKQTCKNITTRADKLFRKQQWSVYYAVNGENMSFNPNMSEFKEIPTPKEFFWADPFVVDKDEKSYIFFEEYVYKTHKGHLSVIEYDHKSKSFSDPKEILNTPYHLSYPFMMEHDGEFYMIPEGSADGDIKLYKAKNFPYEWELVRVMIPDIVAVDMTLFYKDDRWWMFANVVEKDGFSANDELYIYHCKEFLTDTWIPHKQNPVISSVKSSRPAGYIFEYQGEFYRPSQNSVGWYGRATNFNKIVTLTEDKYEEEFVSEITPEFVDGIYAVHTYNASKKLTVIDGLKKIRRFF